MTNTLDPPAWLVQTEIGRCPCGCIGHRRRTSYLAATLHGISATLHNALAADDIAAAPGWLQRLDARTKLISGLAVLVAIAFMHTPTMMLVAAGLAAMLATTSRIPTGKYLRRVWLTVPLFTAFIAIPAMLDVVTPGQTVVGLGTWFGHPLAITAPGIAGALRLVGRTGASISVVILVTMTTPWNRLLAALGTLRVPATFVAVLSMAWRYVFLLSGTIADLYLARRARGAGAAAVGPPARQGRTVISATAGATVAKSHHLSTEVYQAMVARGYTGHVHTLTASRLVPLDIVTTALTVVVACGAVGLDRLVAG